MYAQERQREALQKQVGSIGEWLKSLEIKVRAEPLGPGNLARAAQLLNKTNQMNLSTRRLTEAELLDWTRQPGRAFFTITVPIAWATPGSPACSASSARATLRESSTTC